MSLRTVKPAIASSASAVARDVPACRPPRRARPPSRRRRSRRGARCRRSRRSGCRRTSRTASGTPAGRGPSPGCGSVVEPDADHLGRVRDQRRERRRRRPGTSGRSPTRPAPASRQGEERAEVGVAEVDEGVPVDADGAGGPVDADGGELHEDPSLLRCFGCGSWWVSGGVSGWSRSGAAGGPRRWGCR